MPRTPMLAVTIALPVLLATAPTAAARHHPSHPADRCAAGSLCIWTKPGFQGRMTVFGDRDANAGACQEAHTPIGSVADLTAKAPWRLHLFLFNNPLPRACDTRGVIAAYNPGQTDGAVQGGPVTGFRIYADPNPGRG